MNWIKSRILEWYYKVFKSIEVTDYHIFLEDGSFWVLFDRVEEDGDDFFDNVHIDHYLFFHRNPHLKKAK